LATFRDAKALAAHLKKALDATVAESLITVQAELGSAAVSPISTGRFRSSWFAAEGSASSEVAPEGADAANEDARGLRVDSSKTYHLTNSLPYAQAIAVEGKTNPKVNTKSKPANWFIDFVNVRVPKIQQGAAKAVKDFYEL
jgi:hypothetical protein